MEQGVKKRSVNEQSPNEQEVGTSSGEKASSSSLELSPREEPNTPSEQTKSETKERQGSYQALGTTFKELVDAKQRETFTEQLMKILDEEQAPSAMWWMQDGKSFAIKLDKVGEDVLDRFFQGSKYATFTRRLNKWGFRKAPGKPLHLPPKTVVYFHSLFRRDEKGLIKHMSDKKHKKSAQTSDSGSQMEQQGDAALAGSLYPPSAFLQQEQAGSRMQPHGQTNLAPEFLLQQMMGSVPGGQQEIGLQGGTGPGNFGLSNSSIYQLLGQGGQGLQGSNAPGPIAQFLQQQQPQQTQQQYQHQHQLPQQQYPQQLHQQQKQQQRQQQQRRRGGQQQQQGLENFLRHQQHQNQNDH